MGKHSRITDRQLLEWIDRLPDEIANDDSKRAFVLSLFVAKHFFDREWFYQHVAVENPTPGFLRVVAGHGVETQRSTFKIVDFAELLLNLQDIEGIDACLDRMRHGNIEGTYAELDFGRMLYVSNVNFRYVETSGVKGDDYDIEIILPDGVAVCADAKCKIE